MTRDFNKQGRDDERPSSRDSSSSRHGEERSPRPARPRLNRKMVDQAWETGARPNHADYRTRSSNVQSSRENWRDQQQGSTSAQNSRNNRTPYGNRQDSNRNFDRPSQSNQGFRPRSSNPGPRSFDDQRFNDRRSYSDRPRRTGYNDDARNFEQRPQRNDRYPGRDNSQNFDRNNRPPRNFDRDSRPPRNFERSNQGYQQFRQREPQNPRWQSRPVQRDYNPRRQNEGEGARFIPPREPRDTSQRNYNSRRQDTPQDEKFEGDYERFNAYDAPQRSSSRFQDAPRREPEERHITRLPDGRVLKGPRPLQRKNAEFWTDVAKDTDSLVSQVVAPVTPEEAKEQSTEPPVQEEAAPTGKPKARTRTASAVARGRKPATKKSAAKPRSTGPKPSRRGYKWPTPES